ncbi:MAG: carboxypeptidase-like regulatory domain-containing protein [Ignavibacteria bacterium]|jgi:hypothetical protein|nr:carboxypeptidase-like regulatory domain-containing protein [Ignavibacteria bacterium]
MKKYILPLILLVLIPMLASGATTINSTITGVVKDANNKPLAYVFVSVKDYPDILTATDANGEFKLSLADAKLPVTLQFYSVIYKPTTFTLTNSNYKKRVSIKLVAVPIVEPKKNKNKKDGLVGLAHTDAKMKPMIAAESSSSADVVADGSDRSAATPVETDMKTVPFIEGGMNGDQNATAGKLTAGELNDFAKWELWSDVAAPILSEYAETWKLLPSNRYVAQLTNEDAMPLVDATVTLLDRSNNIIWQARTDNTGKAELWSDLLKDGLPNAGAPYTMLFRYNGQTKSMSAIPFTQGINTAVITQRCSAMKQVDISFVVDATGSMGDEIAYLKAELEDVIGRVKDANSDIVLRTGSVFYRDYGDEYLTLTSPLTEKTGTTISFIKEQSAGGGGDIPEAVDDALTEAIERTAWSENALARIVFLILDAPPHHEKNNIEKMHRQIRLAATKGIRIVPLVCSGIDKSAEFLCRSIALATNGSYVFLTDESGIGGEHLKPTTDKYDVEKLNHILLRIITQYATQTSCNYAFNPADTTIGDLEKYLPKPYDEQPVDTIQLSPEQVIRAYPNPCTGVLTVDLERECSDIFLADITGKILMRWENPSNSLRVALYPFANGVFFVNAYHNGKWYLSKIILMR